MPADLPTALGVHRRTSGAEHAAAALVGPDGVLATYGDTEHRYEWASVTKPFTARTVLIAAERGLLDLDEPRRPAGLDDPPPARARVGPAVRGRGAARRRPGRKRIYSNPGFDLLGDILEERTGKAFNSVLVEWVLTPLGLDRTFLSGRPSEGLEGPLVDLTALRRGSSSDRRSSRRRARPRCGEVALPGARGRASPASAATTRATGVSASSSTATSACTGWAHVNSPATFGHFGGSGTFLWVDPAVDRALVVLTDRAFGAVGARCVAGVLGRGADDAIA